MPARKRLSVKLPVLSKTDTWHIRLRHHVAMTVLFHSDNSAAHISLRQCHVRQLTMKYMAAIHNSLYYTLYGRKVSQSQRIAFLCCVT